MKGWLITEKMSRKLLSLPINLSMPTVNSFWHGWSSSSSATTTGFCTHAMSNNNGILST
jgi:hypothetical protein